MKIIDYGVMDYSKALEEQERLRSLRIKDEITDTVMLLEHNHIYTIGKDLISENALIRSELNAPLININRGGKITYHGPGQLVAYLIWKIEAREIGKFIDFIEDLTIDILNEFGIEAYSRKKEKDSYGKNIRGAWCKLNGIDKKIAAQGIETKRSKNELVTMHGLALNVNTNLNYFKKINPCGFTYDAMSSMQEILGKKIDLEIIKKIVQVKLNDSQKK